MRTIKELRSRTGLSQAKFAEEYHIHLSTLRRWEQEQSKTPEYILYALSRLINIDFSLEPSTEELIDPILYIYAYEAANRSVAKRCSSSCRSQGICPHNR